MPKTVVNANVTSNVNSAGPKLTDAQLAMMHAALRREDRCLSPRSPLRGAQIIKTGEKLIAAGLVREVKAKAGAPIWRRDAENGAAFALKLTAAGAKAAALAETAPSADEAGAEDGEPRIRKEPLASAPDAKAQVIAALPSNKVRARGLPRPTSKLAAVVDLLGRTGGAPLADLVAATGWLPHTTRAALTGLRKRGYVVTLDRSDQVAGSVYHIEAKPGDGSGHKEEGGAKAA